MKEKKPDFLDLVKTWSKKHRVFKTCYTDKVLGKGCSDGGVLLFYRHKPKDLADSINYQSPIPTHHKMNYLMSISLGGACWNHSAKPRVDLRFSLHDKEIFTKIEQALRQVYEN